MITPETNALLAYNRAVEAAAWAKIEAEKAGMPMHFRRFDADIAFKVIDLNKKTLMPSTQLSVEDAQRAFSMIEANVLHDFAPKPDQFSIVRNFLDGLALLSDVDQVINSDEEGHILEGAGQSGFEMVDDNGNLFVVHTNDLIKYVKAQRAPSHRAYPADLTHELLDILGTPIFKTAPMAHAFRKAGAIIPTKMEAEQAYVLDKMIRTLLTYGVDAWRREFDHSLMMAHVECKRLDDAVLVAKVANRLDQ